MNFLEQATFRKTLLNYFTSLWADEKNKVANVLAPIVPVPAFAGHYRAYDSIDAFQLHDTIRQPGQDSAKLNILGTEKDYVCEPNALDAVIPMQLLDMPDRETALVHYEAVLQTLKSDVAINHEQRIMSYVASQVTAESGYGTGWSTASGSTVGSNPLSEIEDLYYQIATDTGVAPNTLVVGRDAWRYIKYAYSARGTFPAYLTNDQQVKDFFANLGEGLKVYVAFLGYSNNKGQSTRTMYPITGKNDAYILYSNPSATPNDRSAFKTFQYGVGFDNVRSYKTPDQRDTYLAIDWNIVPKFTNKYAIKRITCT